MLLDLGLPRRDGLAAAARAARQGQRHARRSSSPRATAVADRVAGLDAGADDYLVKPFDLDELGARMRALLRRHAGRASPRVRVGELTIDPATREVAWKGREVELSGREYALLAALADRPGAILSRAQLEERVYGWNEEVGSNAIEVHIHALRRKLDPALIRNVRGVGYTLCRRAADVPAPATCSSGSSRACSRAASLAAAVVYFQALGEANEIFDYQLRQLALSLRDRSFSSVGARPGAARRGGARLRDPGVGPGRRAGSTTRTRARACRPFVQLGFGTVAAADGAWRLYAVQQRGLTIQVAQPTAVRDRLAANAAFRTLVPFLVALPLMGLLIWRLVGRALRSARAHGRGRRAAQPGVARADPGGRRARGDAPARRRAQRPPRRASTPRSTASAASSPMPRTSCAARSPRCPCSCSSPRARAARRSVPPRTRRCAWASSAPRGSSSSSSPSRARPRRARRRGRGPVDLASVARAAVAHHAAAAGREVPAARVHGERARSPVSGDQAGLAILAENLVAQRRALHASRGGIVRVSTGPRCARRLPVRLRRRPRHPAEERGRVFDRFYRGEGARGRAAASASRS